MSSAVNACRSLLRANSPQPFRRVNRSLRSVSGFSAASLLAPASSKEGIYSISIQSCRHWQVEVQRTPLPAPHRPEYFDSEYSLAHAAGRKDKTPTRRLRYQNQRQTTVHHRVYSGGRYVLYQINNPIIFRAIPSSLVVVDSPPPKPLSCTGNDPPKR